MFAQLPQRQQFTLSKGRRVCARVCVRTRVCVLPHHSVPFSSRLAPQTPQEESVSSSPHRKGSTFLFLLKTNSLATRTPRSLRICFIDECFSWRWELSSAGVGTVPVAYSFSGFTFKWMLVPLQTFLKLRSEVTLF